MSMHPQVIGPIPEETTRVAPEWLREHTAPEWFDRYSARIEESRLPKGQEAREQYAELIGADGSHLLSAIYEPSAPGQLQDLPAVEILRRTWVCHYYAQEGRLRWRKAEDLLLLRCAPIPPLIPRPTLGTNAAKPGPDRKSM
jgi:hypothetical protein